jgi:hypothetical protein
LWPESQKFPELTAGRHGTGDVTSIQRRGRCLLQSSDQLSSQLPPVDTSLFDVFNDQAVRPTHNALSLPAADALGFGQKRHNTGGASTTK